MQRRFASTGPVNTDAAAKKAQEMLGSAQKGAEQAVATAKKVLGPLGERAGGLLGCK